MAVGPRDIGITREEVYEWLQSYEGPFKDLRPYLEEKIAAKELPDDMVDVRNRDDIDGDEINVVDVILGDLGSYV